MYHKVSYCDAWSKKVGYELDEDICPACGKSLLSGKEVQASPPKKWEILVHRLPNMLICLPWCQVVFRPSMEDHQYKKFTVNIPDTLHKVCLTVLVILALPIRWYPCLWFLHYLWGNGKPKVLPKEGMTYYLEMYKVGPAISLHLENPLPAEAKYAPKHAFVLGYSSLRSYHWVDITTGGVAAWIKGDRLCILDVYNWDQRDPSLSWWFTVGELLKVRGADETWIGYGTPFVTTGSIELKEK